MYQYNINNNGDYEDDWDFPVFSFTKMTAEEFKAVVERAHDELLKKHEEFFIRPGDVANKIVEIDNRFFHSKIHLTAVIEGWHYQEDWDLKFKGVY